MTAKRAICGVGFNRLLKLRFLGSQVTTDAGLLAYRELDKALGLAEVAVTRNLFAVILNRIARLAIPPPVLVGGMPV